MNFHSVSARQAQPKNPGDTLQFTPQYIGRRTPIEGGEIVELGLSRNDQERFSVNWVVLECDDADPKIELHQNLIVTVVEVEVQNWTRKQAFVVHGTAQIVSFTPKYVTRVDGIPLADCRNLQKQFGPGFPVQIAADPSCLTKTRYSKEKKAIIVRACELDAIAEAKDPGARLDIVAKLCACGVTKGKARRLAKDFDPEGSP